MSAHLVLSSDVPSRSVAVRTLIGTQRKGTAIMGKHLLDETAEFTLPALGRHAAEDDDHLETTNRFDDGFSRRPSAPGVPQDRTAR